MPLREVNEEFYKVNSDIEKRVHEQSKFDPGYSLKKDSENFKSADPWQEPTEGIDTGQKKIIKIGIIVLSVVVAIAIVVVAVYKIKSTAFGEEKVVVTIDGPTNVDSSQLVKLKIICKNNNRVDLKDAKIVINYSENFHPEENANFEIINGNSGKIAIGDLKKRSQSEVELKGRFYAPEEFSVSVKASLKYTPSNFSSVFEAQAQKNVTIKSPPIVLDVSSPVEVADGNNVEYIINYKNSSPVSFEDLRIKVEYPEGFAFQSAEPNATQGNNFWYIGKLYADAKGQINIRGILQGKKGENKSVQFQIGVMDQSNNFVVYSKKEKITRMISAPLLISQTINGQINPNVNAGEELNYQIKFKNDGEIGLRDVIVAVEIKSAILDLSRLRLSKGSYDSSRGMIIWKAVDVPQLANLVPGAEGEVEFLVPVLQKIPIAGSGDKNFTIESIARIDSPDVPTPVGSNKVIFSNRLLVKLNAGLILETQGYYTDQNITNSGPIPPKVGSETTFTIHWLVSSPANSVGGARVESSLPTGIKFTGKIFPENENISYNERTNKLVWEIGNIENGTGVISPKKEAAFQVSIVPQVYQVKEPAVLLNTSTCLAKDLFTGEEIKAESREKKTCLEEDASLKDKCVVVE